MKTVTRLAIASLMMVMALAGWVHAQTPVKVTFRVNTSTVKDTLRANDIVQMRGVVNGKEGAYNGKVINWGSGSEFLMEHKGNNTWELEVNMTPGDTITFKYWVGYRDKNGNLQNTETKTDGWESSPNRTYILPKSTSSNIVRDVEFYNNVSVFGPTHPDTVQVHFRVNVGRAIQDGQLDLNNPTHKVAVRGDKPLDWGANTVVLERETNPGSNVGVQFYSAIAKFAKKDLPESGNIPFKYVIDTGNSVTWEDRIGGNREFNIKPTDLTLSLQWVFFDGLAPTQAKRINTSFNFAIQVGALERLGFFDASKGDSVFVNSDLTGWDQNNPYPNDPRPKVGPQAGAMTYESSIGAWSKIIPRPNTVVGASLNFKYYIQWDKSRFVNNVLDVNYRPNSFIPGLTGSTGYEEPGEFGGGNRVYKIVDSDEQFTFNVNEGISFFNGIPYEAFISKDNTQNGSITVKFSVDMNPAKTTTQANRTFNPQKDSVFIHFETKFFARSQGTIPGDEGESVFGYTRNFDSYRPTLKDLQRIQLKDPDGDGIYTLDFPLTLPTLNDIGYRIVYGQPLSNSEDMVIQQLTLENGRRYYQYIKPVVVNGQIRWPSTYSFPMVAWKFDKLPIEPLPNYTAILASDEGEFSDLPEGYTLNQNYPNPFNPSTTITFSLPQVSDVRLTVYNALGQKVATVLNNQRYTSGMHSVNFDASRLASGVYIYRLEANNFTADRKMVLIK